MDSKTRQQQTEPQDQMDEAYHLLVVLFMEKFSRASGIWWKYWTRDGHSLHEDVSANPGRAIERLTEGKLDEFNNIMVDKCGDAFITWAIERMGEDFEKYVGRGLEAFCTRLMLSPRPNRSFLDGVRESLLHFPVQLKKESGFPLDKFSHLKAEYETALSKVSKLKRTKWRGDAGYTWSMLEALPGITKDRAKHYLHKKPSEVALDYVAREYKLPLGGASLKKYLNIKRIPQDIWEIELKRIPTPNRKRSPRRSLKPVQ